MHIGLVGNGKVSQSLINVIDKDKHYIHLYARNFDSDYSHVFDTTSSDLYSVIKDKKIDIVIDLLAHTDEAMYISRKIIMDSLTNNKSVITANKKLMRRFGNDLCNHAKNTNGELYINALVANSSTFKPYGEYLSIDNFDKANRHKDIFMYRGAGPDETALSVNEEINRIWKKNAK